MDTEMEGLAALAAQINEKHLSAQQKAVAAVEDAVEAGRLLLQAKAQLRHGAWLPWLQAHCTLTVRQSQSYMRLANVVPKLDQTKYARVAHLPIRQALNAIAISYDVPRVRAVQTGAKPDAKPDAKMEEDQREEAALKSTLSKPDKKRLDRARDLQLKHMRLDYKIAVAELEATLED